ncbi:hypothetical protein [Streptomyces sp. NBC_01551]|uniref:hypothetical protein n=1 Tax=Streptomyces sp. NBC_01551 TaxID=2975876 RepID=UPI0022579843|nr:hypothetical protein [Streptomyces sp. NBC_01551]
MAGAVLAASMLAGCGGPDGAAAADPATAGAGKGGEGGGKDGKAAPRASAAAKPAPKLNVPPAYDGSQGWDHSLPWVPGSVDTIPVAAVPGANAVALLNVGADGAVGYTVQLRAADSGQVRWTSAPWKLPTPVDGASGAVATHEGAEIPGVTSVEQNGHSYVVAHAHGKTGEDALHEGAEVVRLSVYRPEESGSAVKPVREIDVPVHAKPGEYVVRADGGKLLVAYGGRGRYPTWSAAVDVETGTVTPYEMPADLLSQCAERQAAMPVPCRNARVMAAGADGPLVAADGGFGVPGRWFSEAHKPEGVAAKGPLGGWNGKVYGVAGGRVLATWQMEWKAGVVPVWSVHDQRTGALTARMECDVTESHTDSSLRDYPVVSSPSGRFLAAGPIAFDLERKQGICLWRDGNRKTIAVSSIRDDGTAYGEVEDSDTAGSRPAIAQLNLTTATGEAKALDPGVEVPQHTAVGGSGMFVFRDENKDVRLSLRRARP